MKSRRIIVTLVVSVALVGLGACGDDPSGVGERASASMVGPDGAAMGTVVLTQGVDGVLVAADVSGLSPGPHGFHIHTVGACTPDFGAAGDHFAAEGREHGYMNEEGWHSGDLPNIHAGDDGVARADYFTERVSLIADADSSVFDDDGSAIIIHEKPDSYGADAGAGGRVACGVIERG